MCICANDVGSRLRSLWVSTIISKTNIQFGDVLPLLLVWFSSPLIVLAVVTKVVLSPDLFLAICKWPRSEILDLEDIQFVGSGKHLGALLVGRRRC